MKIFFDPDFTNIFTFYDTISDLIQRICLGKEDDPLLKSNITNICFIVLDTTGISINVKNMDNKKIMLEASNIRNLDLLLYIASETHQLSDNIVASGNIDYRKIYEQEIYKKLDELGLNDIYVEHNWVYEDKMIIDYLSFELNDYKIEACMKYIKDYIDNHLVWSDAELNNINL